MKFLYFSKSGQWFILQWKGKWVVCDSWNLHRQKRDPYQKIWIRIYYLGCKKFIQFSSKLHKVINGYMYESYAKLL